MCCCSVCRPSDRRATTRDPAIARGADTRARDERRVGSDTGAPADDRPAASRRIVAIVNPATHGNAAIVDLLRRHAPADADRDVRLTQAAGTTTALAHERLADGERAVVAVGGDGTVAALATALRGREPRAPPRCTDTVCGVFA